MDEYRKATTTHTNTGFNSDVGQRFALPENTSFYSEDESFSRMTDQPSMHSSYTQESGRVPRRYPPQTVPAASYYESPAQSVVRGGQSDQNLLFNYQPKWMKNMPVDTYTAGQAETTMDQSTYTRKEKKIKVYFVASIVLLIVIPFFPCGIVALLLSFHVRQLRDNGQTVLAKKRSRILLLWILIAPAVLLAIYVIILFVLLFCGFKRYSVDAYFVPHDYSDAGYCWFGAGIRETYL